MSKHWLKSQKGGWEGLHFISSTEFFTGDMNGDTGAERLSHRGVKVAAANLNGSTVLMLAAAAGGYKAAAKQLLDHSADVAVAAHDSSAALTFAAVGCHEVVPEVQMWQLRTTMEALR